MTPNTEVQQGETAIGYVVAHDQKGGNFFKTLSAYEGMKQIYGDRCQLVYAEPSPQQGGELPQDERSKFEAYIKKSYPNWIIDFAPLNKFYKGDDGAQIDLIWEGWQAALAQRAASVPAQAVGEVAAQGRFTSNVEWFAGYMPPVGTKLFTAPVPAASVPDAGREPFSPTEKQFSEWCERHDMQPNISRDAFDDAASLYLTAAAPQTTEKP